MLRPLIASLCLSAAVVAESLCNGCRPVEYQNSPSIGLDFTLSYGTAVVQYRNGTVMDVVKIDGSPAYLQVMKQLADDVQKQQRGEQSTIPPLRFDRKSAADVYDPRWPDAYDIDTTQKVVRAIMKPLAGFLGAPSAKPEEPLPAPDRWTKPLLDMVVALTSRVFEAVPEAEKFVLIASPDALRANDLLLFSRLRHAVQLAGLEEWNRSPASSILAAGHLKFGEFPEDHKFSFGKDSFRALVITHTETAMTLADVQRNSSLKYEVIRRAAFVKPPVKHTKQHFTKNVRMALQQFVSTDRAGKSYSDLKYDEIILLGSLAEQEELRDGLALVFEDKIKNAKGESKIRSMSAEDRLYAAARGAASVARHGLDTGFRDCVPNEWCPQPEPLSTAAPPVETEFEASEGYTHAEL